MKRIWIAFLVGFVGSAITCSSVWAQATAQVSGTVRDQTGAVLPGVEVTVTQTETGVIMISPLPGATPTKPGSCTRPLPGIKVEVVTREGEPVPAGSGLPDLDRCPTSDGVPSEPVEMRVTVKAMRATQAAMRSVNPE